MSGYLGQKMGGGEMDYRGTCKNFFGGGNVLYLDWGSAYMSVVICQITKPNQIPIMGVFYCI